MFLNFSLYFIIPQWGIPYPNISYPAFILHLTFALLQSFLEHRLISLATQLLLSTDRVTWSPLGMTASGKITDCHLIIYLRLARAQKPACTYDPETDMCNMLSPEYSPVKERRASLCCPTEQLYCTTVHWHSEREKGRKKTKGERETGRERDRWSVMVVCWNTTKIQLY